MHHWYERRDQFHDNLFGSVLYEIPVGNKSNKQHLFIYYCLLLKKNRILLYNDLYHCAKVKKKPSLGLGSFFINEDAFILPALLSNYLAIVPVVLQYVHWSHHWILYASLLNCVSIAEVCTVCPEPVSLSPHLLLLSMVSRQHKRGETRCFHL